MTADDAARAAVRPIIGLTTSRFASEEGGVRQEWDGAHTVYAEAIAAAGGLPVLLPSPAEEWALAGEAAARRALDAVEAVVLTGGGDLGPAHYGQPAHPATKSVDRARDEFETALVREAVAREVPVLGICRGAQVICVALGGDLVQDIATQVAGAAEHARADLRRSPVHEVKLAADSRLAAIYGTDTLAVNSTHHQAPGRLAGGMVAAGHSAEGVIEATELPSSPWAIGVQWHPEELWKSRPQHALLFEAFVRAAADAAERGQERMKHAV